MTPSRLVAEIDQHAAVGNADHLAFDQFARVIHRLLLLELLEDRAEIDLAAFSCGSSSRRLQAVVVERRCSRPVLGAFAEPVQSVLVLVRR